MRPVYLEVQNFMGHEHEKLTLPDTGIFFLSGHSGAGKSSFIVDAIGYALFGPKATRVTRSEQLRHIDHPGEAMEVRAHFSFEDGSQMTVVRGINAKGSPWAEVWEPDPEAYGESILLADTAQRVNRIVRKRLGGMTWQQFYAAFVARQVDIDLLTTLRGRERKELIHRLLGLRELEKASEEVTARLRAVRAQLKGLESQLGERDEDSEDEKIKGLQGDLERQLVELEAAETDLLRLRGELSSKEAEVKPLEESSQAKQEADRLRASLATRGETLVELEKSAARSKEASAQAERLPELEAKLAVDKSRVEGLRADYARSSEHSQTREELALREASLRPLREEKDDGPTPEELTTRQKILEAELARLHAEEAERRPELDKLKETDVCPLCLQSLGEGHEHDLLLEKLEKRLDELTRAAQDAVGELTSIEEQLPGAQERHSARIKAERDHAEIEGAVGQMRERLALLESEGSIISDLQALKEEGMEAAKVLESSQEMVAQAKSALSSVDREAESKLEETKCLISSDEEALAAAQAKVGEDFDESALPQSQQELQELRHSASGAEARVPELRKQADSTKTILGAAEREKEALLDKLQKVTEVRKQVVRLEDLQTYLQGFQRKLATDIRPPLEEMGSEMLEQISAGKHVAMRIDDGYEIEIQTNTGAWLPATSLSGGESVRVNICLRLALTRLVSQRTGIPVRTLVLDEPLPAQDPGHVQRIMELLDSLRHWYPQQFIMSHVGEVRSSDEIDYVIDFDGEGDEHITLSYA